MSNGLPDITINLSDPEDVREHLPAARHVAEELRREAQELVDRAERWDQMVAALEALAGAPPRPEGAEEWDGVVVTDEEVVERPTMAQITEFIGEGAGEQTSEQPAGPAWPTVDGLFVGH